MSSSLAAGVLALCTLMSLTPLARAGVYHSRKEALALAFPRAERVEPRSFVLTHAQVDAVEKLARAPLDTSIVTFHLGWRGEQLLGYALIDVHSVRTLPEALMIVLTPQGSVRSVRVLAFHEPEDYLPPKRWFKQFAGRRLGPDLQLKRGIHAIAGSTLSARATTRSVRRGLALYQVLFQTQENEME